VAQTARLDHGDDFARSAALIATLSYIFARINAGALKMKVEDLAARRRMDGELHEKGG
jgi:hypothetical protein